uniref:Ig-like domain-containing protein n=1 Tax=Cynoglossus semilaevis TaxID=244447 RepID=A0A3P8UZL8_CYNSE
LKIRCATYQSLLILIHIHHATVYLYWSVTLGNQCALIGSSLVLKCEYDYPYGHVVNAVSWSKVLQVDGELMRVPLSELPEPPDHFRYVGNYHGLCNLRINDVRPADQGRYYFSFVTTFNRWRKLTAVLVPSTVSEGESVRLICRSGCGGSPSTVWFRDGQRVQESDFQVSREDAGKYHCAIRGQESVISASVTLNVQYAPKNVTLLMPEKVIAGSSVTITCSSEANPAVTPEGYNLYKDGQLIVSGQNVTIADVRPNDTGLYHCTAWNNIMGEDVTNSTEVYLDVQYGPTTMLVSMNPHEAAEGGSVNMTCSSDANPAADSYTWYRQSDSNSSSSMLWVGSGKVLTLHSVEASDKGVYVCQARNSVGERNSSGLLLVTVKKEHHGLFDFSICAVVVIVTIRNSNDQLDNVYANPMETCPPSPSAHSALRSQRESVQIYDVNTGHAY